ncbi:MAG: putative toxin-antitoxin system toxin component, PIN family [Candidatus Limnocylindria bacterium]
MRRVVLDPNVLISALLTPRGASARILVELRAGAFELITSPALLAELRAVLGRAKFRADVTLDEVEEFLELIRRESMSLEDPEPSVSALSEDPGDEYLIRLAGAANADVLVSGDPHLLRLRSRIPVESSREFIESLR